METPYLVSPKSLEHLRSLRLLQGLHLDAAASVPSSERRRRVESRAAEEDDRFRPQRDASRDGSLGSRKVDNACLEVDGVDGDIRNVALPERCVDSEQDHRAHLSRGSVDDAAQVGCVDHALAGVVSRVADRFLGGFAKGWSETDRTLNQVRVVGVLKDRANLLN
jgi:hypothetical protein